MDKVVIIPEACPICGGELRGNRKYNYLCRKCNIYFSENEVKKFIQTSL